MVILFFIWGTCWASFVSTMTWRKLFLKRPRPRCSICDTCQQPIRTFDLLPIIGYCIQRGKCRHCGQPITRFWANIELVNGLAWTFMPLWTRWDCFLFFVSDSLMLILCTQDWFTKEFSLPLLLGGLPLHWLTISPPPSWLTIVITTILMIGYLWPGLGNGDVDWMIIMTLCCGYSIVMRGIIFGCLLALLYHGICRQRWLPFLPFLCSGLLISFIIQNTGCHH